MELCIAHADTVQYHQKSQGLGSPMDKTTTWRPLSQAILSSCRATKLRQRRFRERHRPERQWNWQTWSKFTFFFIGTERIAIPGLPQSGRTAIDCIFFARGFAFRKWRLPYKRRRCKQYTSPRTHSHAQNFLARGSGSHCSVLCVRCLQNIHYLARMS